jgi:hypothetical protein
MTYYKAFDKNLTCINHQFEIGKTYKVEGKLAMCKNGFHYCQNILNCLRYYPVDSRFCEVSIGDSECMTGYDKTVTRQITIDREIVGDELNELLTGVIERTVHITDNGDILKCYYWYKNCHLHRDDDLPAMIYSNGRKEWYKFGKRHRDEDEPAIIFCDGRE